MANSPSTDKRINKSFVINNKLQLRNFAQINRKVFGAGIIVINLLLLNTDELDFVNEELDEQSEPTIHQAISYIPKHNFWYKMINLKIKKKYQIDIQTNSKFKHKCLIVFIKDASIEHFSIYSLKLNNDK